MPEVPVSGSREVSAPGSPEAVIAALQAVIVELQARIADLERQLGLNSGNSGKASRRRPQYQTIAYATAVATMVNSAAPNSFENGPVAERPSNRQKAKYGRQYGNPNSVK